MAGIDVLITAAVVLLIALAIAAGLQRELDRTAIRLAAISQTVRQQRVIAERFCASCGRELPPPT